MKSILVSDFYQTYSFMEGPKPVTAWAVSVVDQSGMESIQGISQQILEKAVEFTKEWTGWGFGESQAWLLFENKEDALFAKLFFGEGSNGKD
jgi:hypothetical protein